MHSNRVAFRIRTCQTCGGDAYLDIWDSPEWRCLQCGRQVTEESTAFATTRPVDMRKAT